MSWRGREERRRARDALEGQQYEQSEGVAARKFLRLLGVAIGVSGFLFVFDFEWSVYLKIGLGILGAMLILGFLKLRRASEPRR